MVGWELLSQRTFPACRGDWRGLVGVVWQQRRGSRSHWEGVCVGAMVVHNMERGEFDFKETQTPGVGSGSQAGVNSEESMGSRGRRWLKALAQHTQGFTLSRGLGPRGHSSPFTRYPWLPMVPLFTFPAFPFSSLCSRVPQVSHALFSGPCSCCSLNRKQPLPLLPLAKFHHLCQFGSNITSSRKLSMALCRRQDRVVYAAVTDAPKDLSNLKRQSPFLAPTTSLTQSGRWVLIVAQKLRLPEAPS